ncbi:MAG: D-glycero-beta-D-manno-heptose 1-phosphate adenylyltransferase [Spirochaetia bacterium]|nr:D-glycero-beta-D-manno-heptose 1-phosphate adenylyltransferase [Spirochaetia bacterium]
MSSSPALDSIHSRIFKDRKDLRLHISKQHPSQKVVFTNGCFDILHHGHIYTLTRAKDLGSILVVGVNADSSVRKLKGPARPINNENDRALLIASLACVDYVIVFTEDTPIEAILDLRPDIHVKGGDYKAENLPERDAVVAGGGRIVVVPYEAGYSTTSILEKSK